MEYIVTSNNEMKYTNVNVASQILSVANGFKCNGNKCYVGTLTVTIPTGACSDTTGNYSNVTPIVFNINPGSKRVTVGGVGVILDGDSSELIEAILTNNKNPIDTTTVNFSAKICVPELSKTRVKAS